MKKQAIPILRRMSPQQLRALIGVLTGAATGAGAGYYVTPHISGYSDVPQARRVSAYTDAILGALAGGAAGYHRGIAKALKTLGIKPIAVPLSAGIGELPPLAVAKMTKERQTAERLNEAAKRFSESAGTMSIPLAIKNVMSTPGAKGVGVGAAAAGLAGLLTGLSRRRSESELEKRTGRGTMVAKDILKYLLPAMLAGGVVGSLSPGRQE